MFGFAIVIEGPQDQQKTLDRFYAGYDVEFHRKNLYTKNFRRVLESLGTLKDLIEETRFSKKADFYGLFGATAEIVATKRRSVDLSDAEDDLRDLSERLDSKPEDMDDDTSRYYSTVIEGPNKLPKRKERIRNLKEILENNIEE